MFGKLKFPNTSNYSILLNGVEAGRFGGLPENLFVFFIDDFDNFADFKKYGMPKFIRMNLTEEIKRNFPKSLKKCGLRKLRAIIKNLPRCDVILTKEERAVGLHYDETTMDAPKVLFKCTGEFVPKLIESARNFKVPCLNSPWARGLYDLNEGECINREDYVPIATIYSQIKAYCIEG